MIPGLDLAVQKMKQGEQAVITIASQYAFGEQGAQRSKAHVPPNATVVYTVELVKLDKVLAVGSEAAFW